VPEEEDVVLLVVVFVSGAAVEAIINLVCCRNIGRLFTIRNAEDHCENTASRATKKYLATMMVNLRQFDQSNVLQLMRE
jgi:hypothetical protein